MKVVVKETPEINQSDLFLTFPPTDLNNIGKAEQIISKQHYPREQLSKILEEYNESIGNDSPAIENIRKLSDQNSRCIVTGQQLGFMSGPSYTILKAITCLQIARETNSIPLFWLATEDHDIGEIDHTYLLDDKGNLQNYRLNFAKRGKAVEDLDLQPQHFETINRFLTDVGQPIMHFQEGMHYAKWMAQLLVKMLEGTGLVFIEPHLLRQLAVPFFRKELQESAKINALLKKTAEKMEDAGLQPQLEINEGTNLFLKLEHKQRKKIIAKDGSFAVGDASFSQSDLFHILENEPERFSANVAARPVLQSLLIPTLAYVAGPSEMAYFQQLGEYHQFQGITMPWITPRISATFVTPYGQDLLKECHLNPWDDLPSKLPEHASSLHFLKNLIHPREKPQERVLNWFGFQKNYPGSLIKDFMATADWKVQGHHYCFLD